MQLASILVRYRYIIFEKMMDPGPDPLEKQCGSATMLPARITSLCCIIRCALFLLEVVLFCAQGSHHSYGVRLPGVLLYSGLSNLSNVNIYELLR
jgi:hypothetical protein